MKKLFFICLAVTLLAAPTLWAAESQPEQPPSSNYQYGPGMMGPGGGGYYMGPGMMGPGSGYQGMGPGMMGPYYYNNMGPNYQKFQVMTPEQQDKWRQMRSKYMQDTLALRQELATKQMELQALWDQPKPDPAKVKALSESVAELRSKLAKQSDQYLLECRQEFGDQGWACPGGGWHAY